MTRHAALLAAAVRRWWPVPFICYLLLLVSGTLAIDLTALTAAAALGWHAMNPRSPTPRRLAMLAVGVALLARLAALPPEDTIDTVRRTVAIITLFVCAIALLTEDVTDDSATGA